MIKINPHLYIVFTAYVFFLISVAAADDISTTENLATIHGAVYKMDTFEPLNNAVIEVNSTPAQCKVARDGQYSIKLMPGNYSIKAKYYEGNKLIYAVTDNITIEAEGDYVYDLLLPQVNYENLEESTKKPMISKSIEKINNSNDLSFTGQSSETVTDLQNTANKSFSSNINNDLQILTTKQSSLYSSSHYLLVGSIFCFLLLACLLLLRNYKKIKFNNLKTDFNTSINRNSFGSIDSLNNWGEVSSKDFVSEVKQESKDDNGEAVYVAEVESKTQESDMPGLENRPEWKTRLTESLSKEDKIRISLEELSSNLGIEASTIKKKLLLRADLQEVVDVIQGQGGMISQKDLRHKLNCSEVKISVMLSDLDKMKRIKKFKRGRENLVILVNGKR